MVRLWTFLLLITTCGREGVDKGSRDNQSTKPYAVEEDGGSSKNSTAAGRESFAKNLWPTLKQNCGSCHATAQSPFFASADTAQAEQAAKDKISTQDTRQSRLVQRLAADKHNCWSDCSDNADVMHEAINTYLKSAKAKSEKLSTDSLRISSVYPEGTLLFDANRTSDLKAPTELKVEGKISYLTAPTVAPQVAIIAKQAAGEIKLQIPPQANAYVALYCRGTQNVPLGLIVETTTVLKLNPDCGSEWGWTVATPTSVALSASAFRINGITSAIHIARIAVVKNPDAIAKLADLSMEFDLSDLVGFAATLKATISPFDAKTMKISQLSIKTDQPLQIKGIKPLVNGSFDPIHATYLTVDKDVEAPGAVISDSALILKADFEQDELSFGFDEIGPLP